MVDFFMRLSEWIDQVEAAAVTAKEAERELEEHRRRLENAKGRLETVKGELRGFFVDFDPLAQAPAIFKRQPE
jgi:hypothetical protein